MEVRTTGVPVIGARELRRAADILRRYKQGKQNLERRIIADEDWWKLRQWRQFSDKGNPNDDRPASGWLFNVIMGKHADAVAAYPGPNIRPREPDDRMEAQMLSSILPCILEQNDFEEVYSDTCWQKMKQGTGVWGVYWDQEKLGGLGDISIRPVNVLNLVWEPGVTDIQKSQNVFYLELEDNETLLAAYPQLAGKLGGSSGLLARYRTDDAVDLSEKTLVVDWYYKKRVEGRTVLHYCKYVGETVLYATENDTFMPSVTREARDPETGETVLVQTPVRAPACERGLYDDGEYPFIFDRLFPIEGSICGYGYIDIGKGAQEQIDRMDQAIVKNTIMAATPGWFRRSDGSVNEQEYADWTKPFVHVDGNLGQDSLQQVQVNMLPGICVQVLNNKIEELKWTTGNTDVTNGQVSSGVTAASAIAALQEASGRSSRASTQSAYRAYARLIRMVIERIRQFYDLPRRFRIAGLSGAEEFVSYCNARLKAQSMGPEALMRMPVFDVTVTAQKHTAYTKLAQNELALQFFQLGFFRPGMEQQALACLDMMDFDGKEQVLQKIRGGTQDALWQRMALTLALTEGVIPTGQKFGQSAVTQAVTQYGTYVSVSDQLELHAIDDVILGAAEELGASAGTTQDKLVRNVAAAGTNVQYCDKVGTNGAHTAVTSRAGLDTTAKLTPDEVNKAVTLLKKLKAPKIDGKYIAIIHPSVAYDLRSSEAWIEAHKYAGLTELFTGEIGELHGVRFIETTEAKIFNGEGCPVKTAADESKGTPAEYYSVYATLFLGKDAYGMIDPEGGNTYGGWMTAKADYKKDRSMLTGVTGGKGCVSVVGELSYGTTVSFLGLLDLWKDKPQSIVARRTLRVLGDPERRMRLCDQRLGLAAKAFKRFSDREQEAKTDYYVCRRSILDSAGKVRPVVFYVDTAFDASAYAAVERGHGQQVEQPEQGTRAGKPVRAERVRQCGERKAGRRSGEADGGARKRRRRQAAPQDSAAGGQAQGVHRAAGQPNDEKVSALMYSRRQQENGEHAALIRTPERSHEHKKAVADLNPAHSAR